MSKKQQSSSSPAKRSANWLWWWRVDNEAVAKQVQQHNTLSFFKTYKAVSVLFLLLSAGFIAFLVVMGVNEMDSLLDALVLLTLSLLVARGNLHAIIFTMIFWTVARAWNVYQALLQPEISPGLILLIFAWWCVCMHAFYMTYCVECLHQRAAATTMRPYEQYFFYRFTKVMFGILLIFGLFFSLGLGLAFRPTLYPDLNASFIACDNGKYYGLTPLNLFFKDGQHDLDPVSDSIARKMCEYGTAVDTEHYRYETPETKNYTLGLSYQKEGSWWAVCTVLLFVVMSLFALLNILKETLLYLVLGRPLTWGWLKAPFRF
jgi:hypothetical protein